jgi:chaperonin GroEL
MNYTKELIFSDDAREKVLSGIEKLSKAVKTTLGPCGRNVVIENMYSAPTITKDGVSVAKQIFLKDKFENVGANLVKEVASKTAVAAGDGTTTATVLAESIYKQGLRALTAGVNPNELKRGIDATVNCIVNKLKSMAIEVKEQEQIEQIATISANGDTEIGKVIAEAINTVGIDGTITVADSKGNDTYYEIIKGMEFGNGFLSPFFITNENKGIAELNDCYILLVGKKIGTINELLPILNAVSQQGKPLLIICDEIDTEALTTLILNKTRGTLSVCVVKSPSFGEIRKDVMQDIAVLTNATYLSEELGISLGNVDGKVLGQAKKVTISKNSTTIIDGAGSAEKLEQRIEHIKSRLADAANEYESRTLKRRLSKLTNGVAMIYAGANTIVELQEKKDRIDDALHATIAALEEGIVPGGGTALIKAAKMCKTEFKRLKKSHNHDFNFGIDIILEAINEPLKQIAANGGHLSDVIFIKVFNNPAANFGFNALTGEFVDMVKTGIVDPVKVTRTALESAASVAGLLLTTECIVGIDDSEQPPQPTQQQMSYPGGYA